MGKEKTDESSDCRGEACPENRIECQPVAMDSETISRAKFAKRHFNLRVHFARVIVFKREYRVMRKLRHIAGIHGIKYSLRLYL